MTLDAALASLAQAFPADAGGFTGGCMASQGIEMEMEEDALEMLWCENEEQRFMDHEKLESAKELESITSSVDCLNELVDILHQFSAEVDALDERANQTITAADGVQQDFEGVRQSTNSVKRDLEAMNNRLSVFYRYEPISLALATPETLLSQPAKFATIMREIEESCEFLETHHSYLEASEYLAKFQQLRLKGCMATRIALTQNLSKLERHVQNHLEDAAKNGKPELDTITIFVKFRAAGFHLKPLTEVLANTAEISTSDVCRNALDQMEGLYSALRLRLLSPIICRQLDRRLTSTAHTSLESSARQATSFLLSISQLEASTFWSIFPARIVQPALLTLLEGFGAPLADKLRPKIFATSDITALRELSDCLALDVIEPVGASCQDSSMTPLLSIVAKINQDVVERLAFRADLYIRDSIRSYEPIDLDLDYPARLWNCDPLTVWWPPTERTVWLLSELHNALDGKTFQSLAREAVEGCLSNLVRASFEIERRSSLTDSHLFLLRHILPLRDHAMEYKCQLTKNDRIFDFSVVRSRIMALFDFRNQSFRDVSNLWTAFTPEIRDAQIDTKKDLELCLARSCEDLISISSTSIAQPLFRLFTLVTDAAAGRMRVAIPPPSSSSCPEAAVEDLVDSPTTLSAGSIKQAFDEFWENLCEQLPKIMQCLLLYLQGFAIERLPFPSDGSRREDTLVRKSRSPSLLKSPGVRRVSSLSGARLGMYDATNPVGVLFKPIHAAIMDAMRQTERCLVRDLELSIERLAKMGWSSANIVDQLIGSYYSECQSSALRDENVAELKSAMLPAGLLSDVAEDLEKASIHGDFAKPVQSQI